MPSLADILTYGPGAWVREEARAERRRKLERLMDLANLEAQARAAGDDPATQDPNQPWEGPPLDFDPAHAVERSALVDELGLSEQDVAQARLERTRAQLLETAAPKLGAAEQVNAANRLDVSPTRTSGGVVFNRFNTADPVLAESSALQSLADQRDAQAGKYQAETTDQKLRTEQVRETLDRVSDPILAADIANARKSADLQRAKVKRKDGSEVYAMTRLLPSGRHAVEYLEGDEGPLQVPRSETDEYRQLTHPVDLWRRASEDADAALRRGRYQFKPIPPDELHAETLARYRNMVNDPTAEPPDITGTYGGALRPGTPAPEQTGRFPWQESGAPESQEWGGQIYSVGQEIETPQGVYRVEGFYPDGEPDVVRVR